MSAAGAELASQYTARELGDRLAAAWAAERRERERVNIATRALTEVARTGRGSWTAEGCHTIAGKAIADMRALQ